MGGDSLNLMNRMLKMTEDTLISVIIPVYNVERYLRDCLDSIVHQTYRNFEVILLDDGSTDDCGRISDDYARRDSRFSVIHLENAGVSNARNIGIDASHGQYLMFVDGDDVVSPEMIEILLSIHSKDDDCVSCCNAMEFLDGAHVEFNEDAISVETYDNTTFLKSMYLLPRIINYPFTVWGKLYPRSLIGDIKFRSIICEDNVFNTEVITNHCRLIKYTGAKLYGYRRREGSLMSALDAVGKSYVDRAYPFFLIQQLLPKENTYARSLNLTYLHYRLLHARYLTKQKYTKNSDEYRYAQHVLEELAKKTFKEFVTNRHISLWKKISYLLYDSFPRLYSLKLLIEYQKSIRSKK